jgi:endonuclease G
MANMRTRAVEFLKTTLTPSTEGFVAARLNADDILPARSTLERCAPVRSGEVAISDVERTVAKISNDQELDGLEQMILEAIIIPDKRPAIDIIYNTYTIADPLWVHFDTDHEIKARLEAVIPSVGRIDLPGNDLLPYAGTGFIVGDGLLMTNRHVAVAFAGGPGDLSFQPGASAAVDFLRERPFDDGDGGSLALTITSVAMIHPYWDMALLRVDGLDDRPPLSLSLKQPEEVVDQDIALIGYPAFDPRNSSDVQHRVFAGVYNVKRLMPGKLTGRRRTVSFGKQVSSATHDASTLGGASGSCVIDTHTGEVLALHFGGQYLVTNYGVPSCDLAQDSRIVDAGVNFGGYPTPATGEWDDWWAQIPAATAPRPVRVLTLQLDLSD